MDFGGAFHDLPSRPGLFDEEICTQLRIKVDADLKVDSQFNFVVKGNFFQFRQK